MGLLMVSIIISRLKCSHYSFYHLANEWGASNSYPMHAPVYSSFIFFLVPSFLDSTLKLKSRDACRFSSALKTVSRSSICVHEGVSAWILAGFPGQGITSSSGVQCCPLAQLKKLPSGNLGTKENIPVLIQLLSHFRVSDGSSAGVFEQVDGAAESLWMQQLCLLLKAESLSHALIGGQALFLCSVSTKSTILWFYLYSCLLQ